MIKLHIEDINKQVKDRIVFRAGDTLPVIEALLFTDKANTEALELTGYTARFKASKILSTGENLTIDGEAEIVAGSNLVRYVLKPEDTVLPDEWDRAYFQLKSNNGEVISTQDTYINCLDAVQYSVGGGGSGDVDQTAREMARHAQATADGKTSSTVDGVKNDLAVISENGKLKSVNGLEVPYAGGGIPEAPTDGKQYGRQSAKWTEIIKSENPLTHLTGSFLMQTGTASVEDWEKIKNPNLGLYEDRTGLVWFKNDQNEDSKRVILQQVTFSGDDIAVIAKDFINRNWETFQHNANNKGIEDAPSDGKQYGRKDSAWTEIINSGDSDDLTQLTHELIDNSKLKTTATKRSGATVISNELTLPGGGTGTNDFNQLINKFKYFGEPATSAVSFEDFDPNSGSVEYHNATTAVVGDKLVGFQFSNSATISAKSNGHIACSTKISFNYYETTDEQGYRYINYSISGDFAGSEELQVYDGIAGAWSPSFTNGNISWDAEKRTVMLVDTNKPLEITEIFNQPGFSGCSVLRLDGKIKSNLLSKAIYDELKATKGKELNFADTKTGWQVKDADTQKLIYEHNDKATIPDYEPPVIKFVQETKIGDGCYFFKFPLDWDSSMIVDTQEHFAASAMSAPQYNFEIVNVPEDSKITAIMYDGTELLDTKDLFANGKFMPDFTVEDVFTWDSSRREFRLNGVDMTVEAVPEQGFDNCEVKTGESNGHGLLNDALDEKYTNASQPGIKEVAHDKTLEGDGTELNPLKVNSAFIGDKSMVFLQDLQTFGDNTTGGTITAQDMELIIGAEYGTTIVTLNRDMWTYSSSTASVITLNRVEATSEAPTWRMTCVEIILGSSPHFNSRTKEIGADTNADKSFVALPHTSIPLDRGQGTLDSRDLGFLVGAQDALCVQDMNGNMFMLRFTSSIGIRNFYHTEMNEDLTFDVIYLEIHEDTGAWTTEKYHFDQTSIVIPLDDAFASISGTLSAGDLEKIKNENNGLFRSSGFVVYMKGDSAASDITLTSVRESRVSTVYINPNTGAWTMKVSVINKTEQTISVRVNQASDYQAEIEMKLKTNAKLSDFPDTGLTVDGMCNYIRQAGYAPNEPVSATGEVIMPTANLAIDYIYVGDDGLLYAKGQYVDGSGRDEKDFNLTSPVVVFGKWEH